MKRHIVITMNAELADASGLPDWIDFIHDKSRARESFVPAIDEIFASFGLKFWVTHEYKPANGNSFDATEREHGLSRTYRLILQDDCDLPPDLVARIKLIPSVKDAREIDVASAPLPKPALATSLSQRASVAANLINLAFAKMLTRGRPDVRIAVLDTGVNLSHPELRGKLLPGADFVELSGLDTTDFVGDFTGYDEVPEDEVGHGTHVSGIVAGRGLDMDEGVAPDCRLLPVRVLATMKSDGHLVGAGIVDNINTGLKWAVDHGANVINMSLGIKHTGGGLPHADVIRYALAKGVCVVAASGNDGSAERYYPGALPGVIAVGAVDAQGDVATFTSYGANITVVAPGVNIYSSFAHSGYAFASGTSQASPFVAGAVGLMQAYALDQGHKLSSSEIFEVLRSTSDRADTRLRTEHAGYGLINLADAFKLLTHLTSN